MKTPGKGRLILGSVAFVVLTLLFASQPLAATSIPCGPGPSWADGCPASVDSFPSSSATATVEIFTPSGPVTLSLFLSGPTTVDRAAVVESPTQDTIATQIASLDLSGGGFQLLAGSACPTCPASLGQITQIENATDTELTANSFFDVFFSLNGTPFGPLHNITADTAAHLTATLTGVPPSPGTLYLGTTPVFLFDAIGVKRGILLSEVHRPVPVPEPASLLMIGSGLLALGIVLRRKILKREPKA